MRLQYQAVSIIGKADCEVASSHRQAGVSGHAQQRPLRKSLIGQKFIDWPIDFKLDGSKWQ